QFVILVIKPIRSMRIPGTPFPGNDWPGIEAIDSMFRKFSTNQVRNGGEKIDAHEHLPALGARWNFSRPAHNARFACAPFPARAFPFAQWVRRAGMVAIAQPRSVVRSEDHPGVLLETRSLERGHHLPHRPVDFLDDVAIKAARRLATKPLAHVQRDV